jgi:hypothetical protein
VNYLKLLAVISTDTKKKNELGQMTRKDMRLNSEQEKIAKDGKPQMV